jgi:hypothetical protein
MRWQKKRRVNRKYCKETINRDQFKKCLFRFLKEFGYYSAYLREIKPYCKEFVSWDSVTGQSICKDISFERFLRRFRSAIYRSMFPTNDTYWDTVFYLWQQWAREEDYIDSSTIIV